VWEDTIYALHAQGAYPTDMWQSLFDMIRSNAVTSDPSDNFVTEDSTGKVLDESLRHTNPTPKRVRLVQNPATFSQKELDFSALASEALRGLQAAEDELTKMRRTLTIFFGWLPLLQQQSRLGMGCRGTDPG